MISLNKNILFIVLFLISFIYIFSLPPVFSTGDGGELITASYGLGTPHPSGYPLYVQMGKIFSFLPLGNIGIRIEIVSVFFSILALFIVYLIIFRLSGSTREGYLAGVASIILLAFSYSFFGQSIVAKFYTLNVFFVLLLVFIGVYTVLNGYDRRMQFLASFVLGLTLSCHHTGFMMIVPLFILSLFYYREFLKNCFLSIIFFFAGFSVNLYLYMRGIKESLFSMISVKDWNSFINVFLRKSYGASSSIETTSYGFVDFNGYMYAFKNYFYLIEKNFTLFSIPFFILGLIWLFKKSKKLFAFIFVSFFVYSIFLAKLTFSTPKLDSHILYVVGHQYFIPSFSIYCIVAGSGLYLMYTIFERLNLQLLKKVVPVIVLFFPLLMGMHRLTDQYQRWNYVPYSYTKELFSSLPVSPIYMTFGDNHAFQAWYIKLVGKYREDICHITLDNYNTMVWALQGCKPYKLYRGILPEFFGGNLKDLTDKKRFYSIVALSEKHPLYRVVDSHLYFYNFIYIARSSDKKEFAEFFKERIKKIESFLNYEDCLTHGTDERYTNMLCDFSGLAYIAVAKALEPLHGEETSFDQTITYGDFTAPLKINVKIGNENQKYIDKYRAIRTYNALNRFYLLEGDR